MTKRELRRKLIRDRLERAAQAPVITQNNHENLRRVLLDYCLNREARKIALTWPMEGEVDLRPLFTPLMAAGKIVLLPRVESPDCPMQFDVHDSGQPLIQGLWGTFHSAPTGDIPDLIVVPCLAFDRNGYRLGYGKGMYDRTLAHYMNVPRIGYCDRERFAGDLPKDSYDIALDLYCTPDGLTSFKKAF